MRKCKIGLGCWGFGGDAYGEISDSDSESIIKSALELGVDYFDTSPTYGDGKSENILGKIKFNSNTIVGTKVGMQPHTGFEIPYDFSEKAIWDSVRNSLKRLNKETLDLVLLHSPPVNLLKSNAKLVPILDKVKKYGLVKNWGISLAKPGDIRFFYDYYPWYAIEFNFSLIDQRFFEFESAFNLCESELIVRTPLNFGFLTENSRISTLKNNKKSHLSKWSKVQLTKWHQASNAMHKLAIDWGMPLEVLAIRYIIDLRKFDNVIPGAMTINELKNNMAAYNYRQLNQTQIEKISDIYREIEGNLKIDSPFIIHE